ncbi:MAG: VOC family protein [Blautia sp.]|nr:VOC family protein [Blautia sp.]
MKSILEGSRFAQVGFIVADIETARRRYAALLGCEIPPVCTGGEYEVTGTIYKGKPAPDAQSKLAFFDLVPGVQLELIEPNGAPSVWRDFLNTNGEGLHHIAFHVTGMEEVIKACEAEGMTLVQYGKYGDASGHYAYLDGYKDHKCLIELLESF